MKNSFEPAVLIIAYRRVKGISQILQICKENNVNRIYVALDGPKKGNSDGDNNNLEIRQIVKNFQKNYSGKVFMLFRDQNFGCAASCLSACDWVFEKEKHVIILEDDCIPSKDFFTFARYSLDVLNRNEDVWLACGTQFAPRINQIDSWSLSKYALTWGWVTNQENWERISQAIRAGNQIKTKDTSIWERTYWNQGSRRAYSGWKDVWDTILLQQMISNDKYSILPSEPLVSNIGDDSSATHTLKKSPWLHLDFGKFTITENAPIISRETDQWLRKNFYRISLRHLLTTKISQIRDFLNIANVPFQPLLERWDFAESDRNIDQK
jgi:hypothetical protein